MHLKGHTLLKIRRFLNRQIAAGLDEVETLDQKLIDAYRGWVQGPRGVSGSDGSFPINDAALPLVIVEFEADLMEPEYAQVAEQAILNESEQAERLRQLQLASEIMKQRRAAEQTRFMRPAAVPHAVDPEADNEPKGPRTFFTNTGYKIVDATQQEADDDAMDNADDEEDGED